MGRGQNDAEFDATPVLRIAADSFDTEESETHQRLAEALHSLTRYKDFSLALGSPMARAALRDALTDPEEQQLLREVIDAALQLLLTDAGKASLPEASLEAAVDDAIANLEKGLRMDFYVLEEYLRVVVTRASR